MLIWAYSIFQAGVVATVMFVSLLMLTRLILNYVDPNPFGVVGRFGYFLKKKTDVIVEPSAFFLSKIGIDTRAAPLVTIFAFCIFGYFFLQLLYNFLFTVDGVVASIIAGNLVKFFGFLLYGFLGVYSLLIVIRVVLSWFMDWMNPLMFSLRKVTNPVLEPFRRLIPPVGIIDVSPIIVLLILWFIQTTVASVFLS